ncbi:hypothetical protein MTR67_040919 [Solanum verrucosum]|uniref:Reverse transcriptase zinc-binding domain-containing protein n=1 Tax=Solanum verrucosum TaxID=315347 RepID=A0AAF0ULP5_SOLVR|nr:hypothetical protein MTR67_040919 [Solanum verrucosum]
MEQRALTVDELLQKVHLAMEFEEVIKNEEIAWRQRSRIQWLKNGDKNTKYFHRMATTHKRCNTIDKIEEEGTYITDPEVIKIKIQDYYQNLYKETETWRPNLNLQDFTSINLEEQIWLQRQFEEEEVLKGINLCASDKAPGPDGFPMSFFKEFWSVLKEDILNTMKHFHEFQVFEKIIHHKYGQDSQWCTNEVTIPYGVSTWKTIRSFWTKLARNIKLRIGNGAKILFWKDVWVRHEALMQSFPDLFSFCSNPDITLAESWENGWDISFRRHFNDWEIDRVAQLLHAINEFNGFVARPDTISWVHSEDGRFTVNKLYKKEMGTQQGLRLARWKYVWISQAPTKIKCFVWLVAKRACLTQEVLQRKGEEAVKAKKNGGELFQLAYGGQYGRKEMEDAMRTNQTPYRKSKKIALHICIFGVNRNV